MKQPEYRAISIHVARNEAFLRSMADQFRRTKTRHCRWREKFRGALASGWPRPGVTFFDATSIRSAGPEQPRARQRQTLDAPETLAGIKLQMAASAQLTCASSVRRRVADPNHPSGRGELGRARKLTHHRQGQEIEAIAAEIRESGRGRRRGRDRDDEFEGEQGGPCERPGGRCGDRAAQGSAYLERQCGRRRRQQLLVGARRGVLRAKPLKNPNVSQEFRENTGEANLYVWCSWRLVAGEAIASSDQEVAHFDPVLTSLVGSILKSAEVHDGLHDLILITSAGTLCVFCDHVPPEMSYRINWELTLPNAVVSVGPGFAFEIEAKSPTAPMR
jgi:hypothetical protein